MKNKIKLSFSKSACTYDKVSRIQDRVADKLVKYTGNKRFCRILDVGSGTGSYTEKLIKLNRRSEFVLIDISGPMIKEAKNRLSGYKNKIKFLELDIEKLPKGLFPSNYFDLITSNAVFQWLSGLENLLDSLSKILSEKGILLFSYFGPETFSELNQSIQEYYKSDKLTVPAAGFYSKEKIKKILIKVFKKVKITEYKVKKNYNSLYSLLKNIRQCGSYGYGLNNKVRVSRRDITGIEKVYLDDFDKITATYHYYIICAKK